MATRLVLAGVLLTAPLLAAQSRPLAFEVASIRANTIGGSGKKVGDPPTPLGTGGVMAPQGNQWTTRNVTVRTLIRYAYGPSDDDPSTPPSLENDQVAGGPSWIDSAAFDIVANMAAGPRRLGDLAVMLRLLLAERFALKVHTDTREFPAYALVRGWRSRWRRSSADPSWTGPA